MLDSAAKKCCGVSKRWAVQRPEHVDAVLITHEHSDHSSAMAQMAREWKCPAYLTELTHREILKLCEDGPVKKDRAH